MGQLRRFGIDVPGHGKVQKQHVMAQTAGFQLFDPDGDVGAAGGTHHHVALGQTLVPLAVVDAAAPGQYLHPAAAVLPHRHRHLGAPLQEGGGGPLAHLTVTNDQAPLSGEVIPFLPHPVNGQLGGGSVGGGQQELGFHPLGSRHRVAEQHLQGAAAALGLPSPRQGVFYLSQDLVLPQNHGPKAAGQGKKVRHRLSLLPAHQVFPVIRRVHSLQTAQNPGQCHRSLGADPKLRPVAGGKENATLHPRGGADRLHSRLGSGSGEGKPFPDLHRSQAVVHANHLYLHVVTHFIWYRMALQMAAATLLPPFLPRATM